MKRVVLDASVALGLALPDEGVDPRNARAWKGSEIHAPALFTYEVANGLGAALKRHRLDEAAALRAATLIAALGVRLAPPPSPAELLGTALPVGLNCYDAAYLHLAIRLGADLVTRDGPLAAAARAKGVAVVDAGQAAQ